MHTWHAHLICTLGMHTWYAHLACTRCSRWLIIGKGVPTRRRPRLTSLQPQLLMTLLCIDRRVILTELDYSPTENSHRSPAQSAARAARL